MKVSIALAVYNGTNYLQEQLDSYLRQTRLPDELVAVDDCSTDETVKMLEDFAKVAPFPVHIFRNEENSGSTVSFDRAFSECSGDIIFPSDHDDVWLENKIETALIKFEERQSVGLYFSNTHLVDSSCEYLGRMKFSKDECSQIERHVRNGTLVSLILKGNVVGGATMAFRAVYLSRICPIPRSSSFIHDGWAGLVLGSLSDAFFEPRPTMLYRQHQAQQIGRSQSGGPLSATHIQQSLTSAIKDFEDRFNALEVLRVRLNNLEDGIHNLEQTNQAVIRELSLLEDKIAHFQQRVAHYNNPRIRLKVVWAEYCTGRYSKYSNGLRSLIRDLIHR